MPHYFLSEEAAKELQDIIKKQITDLEQQKTDIEHRLLNKTAIWNDLGNKYLCERAEIKDDYLNQADDYKVIDITVKSPKYVPLIEQPLENPPLVPNIKTTDIFIPRFEYDLDKKQFFENIFFWELDDGRVVMNYSHANYYSTKEKIMQLPYPAPPNYYDNKKLGWNSTNEQAVKKYRKYLAQKEDPDRIYRKVLETDTHISKDGGEVEGGLI